MYNIKIQFFFIKGVLYFLLVAVLLCRKHSVSSEQRLFTAVTNTLLNVAEGRKLRWIRCKVILKKPERKIMPEGKTKLGKPRRKWKDNIRMDLEHLTFQRLFNPWRQ
jgi:hypothetical protein